MEYMNKRFWLIIGFGGGIAIAAVFWIFIWLPSHQPIAVSLVTEEKTPLQKGGLEAIAGYKKALVPEAPAQTSPTAQWTLPSLKEPEFKPLLMEEGEKIAETFLERFSALIKPSVPAPEFAPVFPSFQPTSTKKEQSEIILSLTDEEFHFLYPDAFLTSLMEAQDLFIKEYDPAYEPLSKIETDSQVRFIEEKIVASLLSAGMITEEEAERFITTIRFTLPQLQLTELKNRKSSILNQSFMSPLPPPLFPRPLSKGLFFAELIERLYSVFIPEAQAKVCGYCIYLPECYQVGASMPAPGWNVIKTFCYCTGCYHGQGCLDFCEGMSAIWDPMTGICGCG